MKNIMNRYRIQVSRLSKNMDRSVNRAFVFHGIDITNEQINILRSLNTHGSMNQTSLAEYTGQDRNSLSRTLAILEKKGLVNKESDPNDKRYCNIYVTANGDRIHKSAMQVLETWRQKVFGKISHEDLNSLTRISEQLIQIMEEIDSETNSK